MHVLLLVKEAACVDVLVVAVGLSVLQEKRHEWNIATAAATPIAAAGVGKPSLTASSPLLLDTYTHTLAAATSAAAVAAFSAVETRLLVKY